MRFKHVKCLEMSFHPRRISALYIKYMQALVLHKLKMCIKRNFTQETILNHRCMRQCWPFPSLCQKKVHS